MPIYLRQETKEQPMHDQDPSDSPRLAAADLTEVAGMMRGLSALAACPRIRFGGAACRPWQ